MSDRKSRGRRNFRRRSARGRRSRPRTAAHTPPKQTDWELLKDLLAQQPPQPAITEKSLGDIFVEAAKSAYNKAWKEKDPDSYWLYQLTWGIAPHWPREWDWLLNLTAVAALVRGASRLADKA